MSAAHGFILLVTYVCTYLTLRRYFTDHFSARAPLVGREDVRAVLRRSRKASLAAGAICLVFFVVQDRERHTHSPEARCCKEFERVIVDWESGNERHAVERIRNLANSARPWEPSDLDDSE